MNPIRLRYIELMKEFVHQKKLVSNIDVIILGEKSGYPSDLRPLAYIFVEQVEDKELVGIKELEICKADGYTVVNLCIELKLKEIR